MKLKLAFLMAMSIASTTHADSFLRQLDQGCTLLGGKLIVQADDNITCLHGWQAILSAAKKDNDLHTSLNGQMFATAAILVGLDSECTSQGGALTLATSPGKYTGECLRPGQSDRWLVDLQLDSAGMVHANIEMDDGHE